MKALEYKGAENLQWVDVADAVLQEPDDVIVQPLAVASCDLDWQIVSGNTPFPAPFILGHEFVGVVLEAGEGVKKFRKGDRVAVAFQPSCGYCTNCSSQISSACRSVAPTSMFGVGEVSGAWGGAYADRIRVPFADNMLQSIPTDLPISWFPSSNDNIMDAHRAVFDYIDPNKETSVLILGDYDSIPLYTIAISKALGAGQITFCTRDSRAAKNAKELGASVELVEKWPLRFPAHEVSVCCVQSADALATTLKSTRAGGHSTCTSIFAKDVRFPMREMYMRGINFHTGRVNGASVAKTGVELISSGLIRPLDIDTQIVSFENVIPALLKRSTAKLVAVRDGI